MASPSRSLKALNLGWIWALVVLDAIIIIAIVDANALSGLKGNTFNVARAAMVAAAPVLVVLLSSLLTSDAKAILVFWRRTHVLPGHRAFTMHGPGDPRIDMTSLRKNVGEWPDDADGQNKMWFKLYKKVENDVPVVQAHKGYLLFRDLSALSVILAPFAFLVVFFSADTSIVQASAAAGVFVVQYILCMIAARNSANRMCTNVLSAHAVKRRTA